jgi:hypothetical protein
MARFWNALMEHRLLNAGTTERLFEAPVATSLEPPHAHYGYGVWIDRQGKNFFVEGSDPGVALTSAVYPDEDVILTVIGNTEHALIPLYKEIEKTLLVEV